MFLRCAPSPIAKSLSPELDHRPTIRPRRLIAMSFSTNSSFPRDKNFSMTSSESCNGGGNDCSGGGNWRSRNMNEHYQKMIASSPEDPLIWGNYARFLKEVGDEVKAEECCERAIMAEGSDDGNVLSLYGDLIWQKDKNSARAKPFFDQAVQSSPNDCYVLAAYAKFLWEGGHDEEDTTRYSSPPPTIAAPT